VSGRISEKDLIYQLGKLQGKLETADNSTSTSEEEDAIAEAVDRLVGENQR